MSEKIENKSIEETNDNLNENNEDRKETKKNVNKPLLIVLCLFIVAILLYGVNSIINSSETYSLKDVTVNYDYKTDLKITLPKKWLASDQGELFEKSSNKLITKGIIGVINSTKEEYEQLKQSYMFYTEIKETKINDNDAFCFKMDDTLYSYTYYFEIINDELLIQSIFLNVEDDVCLNILESIK